MKLSRQEESRTKGRQNQKRRTRQALLDAARSLLRAGRAPSITEVAEAALVSVATAYRYFPNPEALWLEVAATRDAPSTERILAHAGDDPAARLDALVVAVASWQFNEEALSRAVLHASLGHWLSQADRDPAARTPVRSAERLGVVTEALAPLEGALPPDRHRRLTMAVTLVFGLEAMVAARDSCGLDPEEAQQVMRWSALALLRAALDEP